MRVNFFGKLADSISRQIDFDLAGPCTAGELLARLDQVFPGAGLADQRVRACVAGAIVGDDTLLPPGEAVEILAPVSGG
jgi:molybdopterin converting factor small subunit